MWSASSFGGEKSRGSREDRSATPGAGFSYFDPIKKKYVTLTTEPVAVTAAGTGAAADSTAAAPADEDLPADGGGADGIAAPATALSSRTADFRPWVASDWFRLMNLALVAAIVISIPYLLWMRRRAQRDARLVELQSAVRAARSAWQKASGPLDFYTAAGQFVLARLALLDGKPVTLVDPAQALGRHVADPVEQRALEAVLAKRDELAYGGGGAGALDPQERRRVADLLENFAKNHA